MSKTDNYNKYDYNQHWVRSIRDEGDTSFLDQSSEYKD